MKKLIRLTESDLHKVIKRSVSRILKESQETDILSQIVQGIMNMGEIKGDSSYENEISDIELDNGNVAFITYEVSDGRYLQRGMSSYDRDVPDDPSEVMGDYDIEVTAIEIYTDDGEFVTSLKDNGMVADAIKDIAIIDESDLDYQDDDYYEE